MTEAQPPPAGGEASTKKKEKRVVVVPTCPSSVASGYALVRGAILSLLGVNRNDAVVNVFQPTYIKDAPVLSGKFSITLGKKLGCGHVQLPTEPQETEDFFTLLEQTIQRILVELQQQQQTIQCILTHKKTAVAAYGTSILDSTLSNNKKFKEENEVLLTYIPNLVLCCIPINQMPIKEKLDNQGCIATLSSIASLTLDRANCNILSGINARKAEITVKFIITTNDTNSGVIPNIETDNLLDLIPLPEIAILETVKVRVPEGEALVKKQEAKKLQEEKQAPAPTPAETPTPAVVEADEEPAKNEQPAAAAPKEQHVDPFSVEGIIDYTKLVNQFGSTLIDTALLKRLEALTKKRGAGNTKFDKLHRFLRRNIFFSHRDLDIICTSLETGGNLYLYTGRGPSSDAMHLGHLVPFLFTQYLQEALGVPLVIQMTDDEKFIFKGSYDEKKGEYNLDHYANLTIENAKDIIACGFSYEKTFLFSDIDYVGRMYPNILKIWKAVTTNTVNKMFGFDSQSNLGKIAFPAIQAAPSFASSFPVVLQGEAVRTDGLPSAAAKKNNTAPPKPDDNICCLIPCAIDQDPYFRMTRDVAYKIVSNHKKHPLQGKPALIHSKFFPPLQGIDGKMSSSDPNTAIFLTDTKKEIESKIKKFAFSGGQETKELQQELGANLEIDVPYLWLTFFLEDDDELEQIRKEYSTGKGDKYWSTGQVKKRLIEVLTDLIMEHQERRKKVTDEEVYKWMKERSIY